MAVAATLPSWHLPQSTCGAAAFGWGPAAPQQQLSLGAHADILSLFAPHTKSDRLGRISDFTQSQEKQRLNAEHAANRRAGGDRNGDAASGEAYSSSIDNNSASLFAYKQDRVDDNSFTLVDNRALAASKPRTYGGAGGFRGGRGGGRGGFAGNNNSRDTYVNAKALNNVNNSVNQQQRNAIAASSSAVSVAGGSYANMSQAQGKPTWQPATRDSQYGNSNGVKSSGVNRSITGFGSQTTTARSGTINASARQLAQQTKYADYARNRARNAKYGNRDDNDSVEKENSILVDPAWQQVDDIALSVLATAAAECSAVVDVTTAGVLKPYNKELGRVTPRAPINLQRFENKQVFTATTSEDPILMAMVAAATAPVAAATAATAAALPLSVVTEDGEETDDSEDEDEEATAAESTADDATATSTTTAAAATAPRRTVGSTLALGNVFATDSILSLLMASSKTVLSFDVIARKHSNGVIVFDKRRASKLDFLTVNENLVDAAHSNHNRNSNITATPIITDTDNINHTDNLSNEATFINHNFAAQLVQRNVTAEQLLPLQQPNPFLDSLSNSSETEPADIGYRYRRFTLPNRVSLVVRCSLNAYVEAGDSSNSSGHKQYVMSRALNEYDSKASSTIDYRQKLEQQSGAILAMELKNNSSKLTRWTAEAVLSGADQVRLGFVSRLNTKINHKHQLLLCSLYTPATFAASLNVQIRQLWGTLAVLVAAVRKQPAGTYLLLRDANKPQIRVFAVPDNIEDYDSSSLTAPASAQQQLQL